MGGTTDPARLASYELTKPTDASHPSARDTRCQAYYGVHTSTDANFIFAVQNREPLPRAPTRHDPWTILVADNARAYAMTTSECNNVTCDARVWRGGAARVAAGVINLRDNIVRDNEDNPGCTYSQSS